MNAVEPRAEKVLIVDDERVIALDLQRTLRILGYRADAAGSGDEALRVAADAPPDIVFMDLRLRGGMDGIDAASQLRSRYRFELIYLTGGVDAEQRSRAESTNPAAWLTKPYSQATLLAALELARTK